MNVIGAVREVVGATASRLQYQVVLLRPDPSRVRVDLAGEPLAETSHNALVCWIGEGGPAVRRGVDCVDVDPQAALAGNRNHVRRAFALPVP